MNHFSKISQQTFWQILGKIVTSLSTFIILGIVARNYGEAGTGVFTLTLTYLAISYLLSDFGFNAHVLRKLKVKSKKLKVEWQKLLGTRLIWSVILVALAIGMLPLWPFATLEFSKAVIFGSLAIVAAGVFSTTNLVFQSQLRYELSVLALSLGTILSLVLFIYLSLLKLPIPFLLSAHLLGWMAVALIALALVRKLLYKLTPIYDIQYAKHLFKDSWPIAATLAVNVVYFRADSFVIAYFKSVSDVGIYNVAYSVFQSALILPTFIMNSYYPLMLKSLVGIRLVGFGLLGLASIGTVTTLIFAPLVINILTAGGFEGSVQSLQILSLGFPAYFLSALLMWLLVLRGKYKQMLLIYALGLVFNLILNFIYIPQYSFLAASWITVISEYLILLMQIFLFRGILFP